MNRPRSAGSSGKYQPGANTPQLTKPLSNNDKLQARAQIYAPAELTAYLKQMALFEARDAAQMKRLKKLALSYVRERDHSSYSEADIFNHVARAVTAAMLSGSAERECKEVLSGSKNQADLRELNDLSKGKLGTHRKGFRFLGRKFMTFATRTAKLPINSD